MRLVGARQLGTGIVIGVSLYRRKWKEAAIVLAIIGVVVAGSDGWVLARAGNTGAALFHAGPGLLIATLAASVIYYSE